MSQQLQLPSFEKIAVSTTDLKVSRSGTFVDNMALPIHRWFRYSAGFSAEWVKQILRDWEMGSEHLILDPFVGSGTVPLSCENLAIQSVGVEAHPVVARICQAKLYWSTPIEQFSVLAKKVGDNAHQSQAEKFEHPSLIQRSFEPEPLAYLDSLRSAWSLNDDKSPASELVWLAITAILRSCSKSGTAQWQYILPNKTKKKVLDPKIAFQQQVKMMISDMQWMQSKVSQSRAMLIVGDARNFVGTLGRNVDAVITSPPYANNYDYADALRFEMTFWGEVNGWGDIHEKVRKHLIVSSSQHSSKEKLSADELLSSPILEPIRPELTSVVNKLAITRENHGGKKHYHTMVAAYCRDIALVLSELRVACRPGAHMCWVIGDSAPYGIYCPIDRWIGELAVSQDFASYKFEKLRDRNTKWKNRKHRVPLKEGLLWIEG